MDANKIIDLLASPNGTFLLCFAGFALFVGVLLSKRGLLSVHTKALSIGVAENERDIIRQQQRWARVFLMGLHPFIKEMGQEGYDDDLTLRCLDRATLAVFEWITLNHISLEEHYVKVKQDELINLMYSLGVKEQYRTPEFRTRMENWIRDLIAGLVSIRRNYK